MGASALEAIVVNATVIQDASKLNNVIDATVIDVSVEETRTTRATRADATGVSTSRRGESATGRAAARGTASSATARGAASGSRTGSTRGTARGTSKVERPAASADEATTAFEPPTVTVQSGPARGRADRTVPVPPAADATVTMPAAAPPVPPEEATVVVTAPGAGRTNLWEPAADRAAPATKTPVETPSYADYTETAAPAPVAEPEEPEAPAYDWTAPEPEPEPAVAAPTAPAIEFVPANEVEADLLAAATSGQTDKFLSTLLLARVLIPVPYGQSADLRPNDPNFPWRREEVEGHPYLVVFTSAERMAEFMGEGIVAINARFIQLINHWPDVNWAFAVNPGSPVGATLPGAQIKALAVWAADVGLTDDEDLGEYEESVSSAPPASTTIIMQKPIAPSQVDYYLERGYDRASGFVHRAGEVMHLHTPDKLYATLGLSYSGSPFSREATEVYVLRWAAHRPDLYRIPYGGPHEAAMRAMQGWMIERTPFRGNGFAPAEDGQVIAEFKVDSIRLPHGAQMWRLTSAGSKTLVAVLDSDECLWRPVRGVEGDAAWDPSVPLVSLTRSVEATASSEAIPSGAGSGSAFGAGSVSAYGSGSAAADGAARHSAPGSDPSDDPLDPRWRGGATADSGARSGDS
jgi:hypothetical protein